ncbi:KdsC family phosphatase [Allorhodopirellula solitaria]|uniref:3-deoxy-D-manno-octulosonate 8-phosphate phosphatase KdsC n=1 Tax=Allorhodopirellula solitaria TaxID=2527987 RepID=A0A5C5YGA4_9BACT|nr:HAD-IIIA family hydrolase [Allorhodopirellula solitaria]TWT74009.1 3-deoxy-D-manno-octulosonate 8-phosphate phosphatase KdsC [Allorhodopirellula solitaria]
MTSPLTPSQRLHSDAEFAAGITCILSDVDGVMTDGRITYLTAEDAPCRELKSFHVRDGLGIKLWMRSEFHFGIITARSSELVAHRAAELGIAHVCQGASDKWVAAQSMMDAMGVRPEQVCYIGDDLPDIKVMRRVGLAAAPDDAATDARESAHWTLRARGGEGALRELIERLLRGGDRWREHLAKEE